MAICYEIIPWDCEGFPIYNRQFPTVGTLLEVARTIRSPADSVMAWENEKRRPLTSGEQAELRRHQDRLHAEALHDT